jgi:hypothetical protein
MGHQSLPQPGVPLLGLVIFDYNRHRLSSSRPGRQVSLEALANAEIGAPLAWVTAMKRLTDKEDNPEA